MAVLHREYLKTGGPFICFVRIKHWPKVEHYYPTEDEYAEGLFFEMSSHLMDRLCDVIETEMIIDPYGSSTAYRAYYDLQSLAGDFSLWAYQFLKTRQAKFACALDLYEDSGLYSKDSPPTSRITKSDMVDTLLFIAREINNIAREGDKLIIIGL